MNFNDVEFKDDGPDLCMVIIKIVDNSDKAVIVEVVFTVENVGDGDTATIILKEVEAFSVGGGGKVKDDIDVMVGANNHVEGVFDNTSLSEVFDDDVDKKGIYVMRKKRERKKLIRVLGVENMEWENRF
ncbi:hypothetical protein RJT34_12192 [Clitoria ternatea]|uniref:Uncharacterized protein n=1 Tax=Clitoria ternatea TaxID=43366 RepID=A0AAN9JLC3_CLITE